MEKWLYNQWSLRNCELVKVPGGSRENGEIRYFEMSAVRCRPHTWKSQDSAVCGCYLQFAARGSEQSPKQTEGCAKKALTTAVAVSQGIQSAVSLPQAGARGGNTWLFSTLSLLPTKSPLSKPNWKGEQGGLLQNQKRLGCQGTEQGGEWWRVGLEGQTEAQFTLLATPAFWRATRHISLLKALRDCPKQKV